MEALAQDRERSPLPWQAAFVLLAATWGSSFMFIKVGLQSLAPLQLAFTRLALGALTLLVLVAVRREALPRGGRVWLHLLVAALVFNALPFSLYALAERDVPSLVAGIWNAMTPLFVVLFAIVSLPDEQPTRERVAGLLVGFVGVVIVLAPWRSFGGSSLVGNLLCLGAAASYGVGFPYTRRFLAGRRESGVSLSAAQVSLGALLLVPLLPFTAPVGTVSPKVVASMIGLGMLGTGIAYVLNYQVIRQAGATTASAVTYLIPLFATVFGVLLLGEQLTWNQPLGALAIIAGVAISQGRPARRPSERAAAPAAAR